MNSELFIEDANKIGSNVLSKYETERYHRNINFYSSFINIEQNKYDVQKKIIDTKVGIVGLGGLGSHIMYDLAGLGFTHFTTMEFDKVELSNLNRQILYNYADLGSSKSQLAKNRLKAFNPEIDFRTIEQRVSSADDIINAFSDVDLLILVADRPKYKIARWANEAIVKLGIPMFTAGLESHRSLHYTVLPHQTGCVHCWQTAVTNNDDKKYEIPNKMLAERERQNLPGDNTAIVPLVSAATALITAEILRFVTGIGELQATNRLVSIDFLTMHTKVVENWERDPSCKICGVKG